MSAFSWWVPLALCVTMIMLGAWIGWMLRGRQTTKGVSDAEGNPLSFSERHAARQLRLLDGARTTDARTQDVQGIAHPVVLGREEVDEEIALAMDAVAKARLQRAG